MATLDELYHRVRDNLYSDQVPEHEFVTQITNSPGTGSTVSVSAGDGESFFRGDVIEFEAGDKAYVQSVSGDDLTVFRSYDGTSAASASTGEFITKNPRFSRRQVEDAINSTIRELENYGVHIFGEGTLTVDVGTYLYDLAEADILPQYGILSLYHEETNTGVPWAVPFRFHKYTSALSAQGFSLEVWDFGELADGGTMHYVYAKLIDGPDDLLARQEEIVVNGATAKILPKTAAPRTKDPGRYTDRTVQPGQGIRDGQWYFAVYERQARAEAAEIASQRNKYPGNFKTSRARRFRW